MGFLRAQPGRRPHGQIRDASRTKHLLANVAIAEMAEFMAKPDGPNAPVTASVGELIGRLVREDAERAAHERHA